MLNGEKSIADLALCDTPSKKTIPETVFENGGETAYRREPPFIIRKMIRYSFGLIADESQANKVILAFVGILFCVAAVIILQASAPKNKVPDDILTTNMERMRSK